MFQNLNTGENAAYKCVELCSTHPSPQARKFPWTIWIRFQAKYNSLSLKTDINCLDTFSSVWNMLHFHILQLWSKSNPKKQKDWNVHICGPLRGQNIQACLYLRGDIFPVSSPFHPSIHPSTPSVCASEMPCVSAHKLLTRRSFSCCICTMLSGREQSFSFSQNGGQKFGREGWFMKTVDCLIIPSWYRFLWDDWTVKDECLWGQ